MQTMFQHLLDRASVTFAVLVLVLFVPSSTSPASVPQAINYQAIARKTDGTPISNQSVKIRATIHQGSANGAIAYQEVLNTTTSAGGQFSLKIGTGILVQGSFSTIVWGDLSHFLQIEIDPAGGNSFTDMGTQQFVSVPYAQHAATAELTDAIQGTAGRIPKFGTGNTVLDSIMRETPGRIGINELTPAYALDVGGTIRSQSNLLTDGSVSAQGSVNAGSSVNATTSVNAASAKISGNAIVDGVVTVKNGRGIFRSNSATQQKIVRVSGVFQLTGLPSNSYVDSGDLDYENFGGVPTVTVGQCSVPGGEWYKVNILPINVTATKCQLRLFNCASDPVTIPPGTTWQFLIVGPE